MRVLALTSIAAALFACARESGSSVDSRRSTESAPLTPAVSRPNVDEASERSAYPPGRWRLAAPQPLFRVLLRMSHILIRYDGVPEGIVSFQLPDWRPSPPAPARTLQQARLLAEQIAERLQKNPGEFAAVAREVSEDIATRDFGGRLGTRTGGDYLKYPEILDAIAALRPGEVSRVVETQYGFHILQRAVPLEEQTISAARILISHDRAPWLGMFLARRPLPERSREEALRIAQSLYERARSGESFEALAREFSDHREALRGGDFGAWSTREATPYPREMELLASMAPGEIHAPIDTPFGVAILQRLPNRPRESFGMTTVQQGYNPRADDSDPSSRKWVYANVQALAREVADDPAKFAALQAQYCCTPEQRWVEGRGEAQAEAMLRQLKPGEIAKQPVELAAALGIVKRLQPGPVSAPSFVFELPAPEKPDLSYLVMTQRLRALLRGFAGECARELALEPPLAEQFVSLLQGLVEGEEVEQEKRPAQFQGVQDQALALLGPIRFRRYLALLDARIEQGLLTPDPSPRGRTLQGMPVGVR